MGYVSISRVHLLRVVDELKGSYEGSKMRGERGSSRRKLG